MKIKKGIITLLVLAVMLKPTPSYAFFDPTGPMRLTYLVKILLENVKRYKQLRSMIKNAKNRDSYTRWINAGIDNATGLLRMLPLEDDRVLGDLRSFQDALNKINQVYGSVPNSKEELMQRIHDDAIGESFKLINKAKDYAKKQEANAVLVSSSARNASPKGAQRMTAQTSAEILHTLNQLIKINGQILKIASTNFAYSNKQSKGGVKSYQRIGQDMSKNLKSFKGDYKMPRF